MANFQHHAFRRGSVGVPNESSTVLYRPIGARNKGTRVQRNIPVVSHAVRKIAALAAPAQSSLGSKPWWTFQSSPEFGVQGRHLVNVANGNLLIEELDAMIPHGELPVVLRRVYNSQSTYDVSSSDGTQQNIWGNGWTNGFDAHISVDPLTNAMALFDSTGARFDFPLNADGTYGPAPGLDGDSLVYNASYPATQGGEYEWIRRDGQVYVFRAPSCPYPGICGRLHYIFGKNYNRYLHFVYWFSNASYTIQAMTQIAVQSDSGPAMNFYLSDTNGHHMVTEALLPDGATPVYYNYDNAGNLQSVTEPGNNTASGIGHWYSFYPGTSRIQWVVDPLYDGTHGGWRTFEYDSSARAVHVYNSAELNPIPGDSTNTPVVSGAATGIAGFATESFTYNSGSTVWQDLDGHQSVFSYNANGSVTALSRWTDSTWLTQYVTWSGTRVSSDTDERGEQTSYQYDANGNLIAMALPLTTMPSGTFRPTWYYDYVGNNLTAVCDANNVHASSHDWSWPVDTPSGTGQYCANYGVARTSSTYATPGYEPSGYVTSTTTAGGYTRTFSHDAGSQGGLDYGQVTSITGAMFTQNDGTSRRPQESFVYDVNGDPVCQSGDGGSSTTIIGYDTLGRVVTVADPDDASTPVPSGCTRTPGIAGSIVVSRQSYYPNGQVASTQSPVEAESGASTTFAYDADGNRISETTHYSCADTTNCTPGVKKMWFDGADRLVEVGAPQDPSDYYSTPWLTRYVYDVASNGLQSTVLNNIVYGHGNLLKSQEYLPNRGWTDLLGTGYDALDREVASINFAPGNSTPQLSRRAYDSTQPTNGLLSSLTTPDNETESYAYDERGLVTTVQYSGGTGTPNESFGYDAVGNPVQETSAVLGTTTRKYTVNGQLAKVIEPSASSTFSFPSTFKYSYYPDGKKSTYSIVSNAPVVGGMSLQYNYRSDGLRKSIYSPGYTFAWQYTAGGRLTSYSSPVASVQESRQYDIRARIAQRVAAGFTFSGFSYDIEGMPRSYTVSGPSGSNTVATTFSRRNEMIYEQSASCPALQYAPFQSCDSVSFANGIALPFDPSAGGFTGNFDPVAGAVTRLGGPSNYKSWGFDSAGRETSGTVAWDGYAMSADMLDEFSGDGSFQATFDAQGRLTSKTYSSWCACISPNPKQWRGYDAQKTLTWGTNDRLATLAYSGATFPTNTYSFHWDGSGLSFVSTPQGTDSIELENLVTFTPGQTYPLQAQLRDFDGTLLPGTAATTWNARYPDALDIGEEDGLHGAHLSNLSRGAWSSGDDFPGSLDDPPSAKSYAIDRNNPIAFDDENGFCPQGQPVTLYGPDGKAISTLACIGSVQSKARMPNGETVEQAVARQQRTVHGIEFLAGIAPLPEAAGLKIIGSVVARRLARGALENILLRAGKIASRGDAKGFVIHHIVAFNPRNSPTAFRKLQEFGIDINDADNLLLTQAKGSHWEEYYAAVDKAFADVTSEDEARYTLRQLEYRIEHGELPLNRR